MLCASIFSEVVLGFMLWTGWLGSAQPMAYNEADCACAPCCYSEPCPGSFGMPPMPMCQAACPQMCCPQTCRPCGMPMGCPCPNGMPGQQTVIADISLTAGRPNHLPPCNVVNLPLLVNGMPSTNVFPCGAGKPCHCSIGGRVVERSSEGVVLELSLQAMVGSQCENYKAKQKVHFNTPTCVVLAGNHPEPVCAQVFVRRGEDAPVPVPEYIPYPAMVCPHPLLPPPAFPPVPMPVSRQMQVVRPPDPLPLPMPTPYIPAVYSMPVKQMPRADIRLVYEAGKARLCVKSESLTTECVRMKLEAGQTGTLRLSAGKNHVHITGTKWKAQADRIELGNDGHIVLTGHVKLLSDKLGVCAAVKADQISVHVKAGKFEKIVDQK